MAKLCISILLVLVILFGSAASSENWRISKKNLPKVTSMSTKDREIMTSSIAPKRSLLKSEDSDEDSDSNSDSYSDSSSDSELSLEEQCLAFTDCNPNPNAKFTGCPQFCDECLEDESGTFCGIAPDNPIFWEPVLGQQHTVCEEIPGCNPDPNAENTGCPKHCDGCDKDIHGTYCVTGFDTIME